MKSVRRPSAFTLLEMLISVAVVGILAALIFPVASSSVEKARAAKCAGNLRALGSAFRLYAADNNNTLPPSYVVGSNAADNNWWFRVSPFAGGKEMALNWGSVAARSMESPFHCPLVKNPDPAIPTNAWVSYKMNVQLRLQSSGGNLGVTAGAPLSKIPQPAKVLLVAEGRQHPEFSEYTSDNVVWGIIYPHLGSMNGLFIDGHVESISRKSMADRWDDIYRYPFGK